MTGFLLTKDSAASVVTVSCTGATLLGAAIFFDSFLPTTTERMAELWKSDPGLARSKASSGVTIRPMLGPFGGGVSGTF